MTLPLIATQSEFLSLWCACPRARRAPHGGPPPASPAGRHRVPSKSGSGGQAQRPRAGLRPTAVQRVRRGLAGTAAAPGLRCP